MSKAQEKRTDGIQAIINMCFFGDGRFDISKYSRTAMADQIHTLLALGKTDRWNNAVRQWEEWVRDENIEYHWAMIQGPLNCDRANY